MSIQDFWEMFIHHVATLALLTLSWSNHMHRMGSLVLIVHDFADHWLELAKLLRYAGWAKSCDACFGIFTLVWAFSRLGLFPSWVCYSTITGAGQVRRSKLKLQHLRGMYFPAIRLLWSSSNMTFVTLLTSFNLKFNCHCYLFVYLQSVGHS